MNQPGKVYEKPRIGITLGDINGIGPEVVIKALMDNRILSMVTPVIYGSSKVLSFYKKNLNIEEFNFNQVKAKGQWTSKNINVVNCWEDAIEITPGKPSREAGTAAFKSLNQACQDLKEGIIDALVTAPIDKNTIHSEDFPFTGHTGFLAKFFGNGDSLMFMISEALKVALVTDHIPVADVSKTLSKELLFRKFQLLENSLKKDFGINKPKIAILGLNPHAGDDRLIGAEDASIIKPMIQELKNKGKVISGPFPADGFFGSAQYLKYDAVLAMYHDQGLIPFKTIAFENGVNFTGGLPVVRTSPDHGTGYQIAGKNLANEISMREAIFWALDILKKRVEPSKGEPSKEK